MRKNLWPTETILLAIMPLVAVILLILGGCGTAGDLINNTTNNTKYPLIHGMEVTYCEGLGYTYEYRMNESSGRMEEYCRLSKDIECEAWAFASGECHNEFTLCKRQGYIPKIGVIKEENVTRKFPICIFPDGSYCREVDFFLHKCHIGWDNSTI